VETACLLYLRWFAGCNSACFVLLHVYEFERQLVLIDCHGLQVLDVSNNRISTIEGLAPLTQLEDLWLNDNTIPSLDGLEEALAQQKDTLTTIYLENNPAAADPGYRARILAALPKLKQLDAHVLEVEEAVGEQVKRALGKKLDGPDGLQV
jgi:hypothetical protein